MTEVGAAASARTARSRADDADTEPSRLAARALVGVLTSGESRVDFSDALDAGGTGPVPGARAAVVAPGDRAYPFLRATPWTVDEEFPYYDVVRHDNVTARVLRVYDGYLVVAAVVADMDAMLPGLLADLDLAAPILRARSYPLLRSAYLDAMPVTSAGSAQMLVIVQAFAEGDPFSGFTHTSEDGGAPVAWIRIRAGRQLANHLQGATFLTHELTHAFQGAYMHATRSEGSACVPAGASQWGREGTAHLSALELLRPLEGADLLGNVDWRETGGQLEREWYQGVLVSGHGQLTLGYSESMDFLRDLVTRRVAAGEGVESALREVHRGAVEGWYGHDECGSARTGLTARMRARLGAAWDPAGALLDWAMSAAIDDRTANPACQNRSVRHVDDVRAGEDLWRAGGALRGGDAGRLDVVRRYGSPGFVYLDDPDRGSAYRLGATVTGVRWLLARWR